MGINILGANKIRPKIIFLSTFSDLWEKFITKEPSNGIFSEKSQSENNPTKKNSIDFFISERLTTLLSIIMLIHFIICSQSNSGGSRNNLAQLHSDLGLTSLVVVQSQGVQDLSCVLGGVLHSVHSRALFRGDVV